MEWISVKERLPEGIVVCLSMKAAELQRSYFIAWQVDGSWYSANGKPDYVPTYWCHLPELPTRGRLDADPNSPPQARQATIMLDTALSHAKSLKAATARFEAVRAGQTDVPPVCI
jgi:hypothetical protein